MFLYLNAELAGRPGLTANVEVGHVVGEHARAAADAEEGVEIEAQEHAVVAERDSDGDVHITEEAGPPHGHGFHLFHASRLDVRDGAAVGDGADFLENIRDRKRQRIDLKATETPVLSRDEGVEAGGKEQFIVVNHQRARSVGVDVIADVRGGRDGDGGQEGSGQPPQALVVGVIEERVIARHAAGDGRAAPLPVSTAGTNQRGMKHAGVLELRSAKAKRAERVGVAEFARPAAAHTALAAPVEEAVVEEVEVGEVRLRQHARGGGGGVVEEQREGAGENPAEDGVKFFHKLSSSTCKDGPEGYRKNTAVWGLLSPPFEVNLPVPVAGSAA